MEVHMAKALTIQDFYQRFPTDDACLAHLFLIRFGKEPSCPKCGANIGLADTFCGECGASLFWEPADKDHIAVSAGSIDQPSGLTTVGHIFTDDKADFYDIYDGLEQLPGTGG